MSYFTNSFTCYQHEERGDYYHPAGGAIGAVLGAATSAIAAGALFPGICLGLPDIALGMVAGTVGGALVGKSTAEIMRSPMAKIRSILADLRWRRRFRTLLPLC